MEENGLVTLKNELTEQEKFSLDPIEEEIIELAVKGDEEAFEKLFMGTYRYVFAVVRRYLKNDEDAYDAIQNTYTRVYKGLPSLKSTAAFYSWLGRIAENCSKDILMQNGIDPDSFSPDDDLPEEDSAPEKDITLDVTAVLKQLPEEQRELLVRVYYDGMTVAELARMQGLPKSTLHNRLKAAKAKLKELLRTRGIDKPIYGGEFVSMVSAALRNAIGTQLLSMAIAEEILHSVTGSENKKGAAVISRFARKQRNSAAKKIAAILLLACLLLVLATALVFSILWGIFGKDSLDSLNINFGNGIFDWVSVFGGDDASGSFDGTTASKPMIGDTSSDNTSTSTETSSSAGNPDTSSGSTSSEDTSGRPGDTGSSSSQTSSSGTSATPSSTKPSSATTSSSTSTQKPASSANSSTSSAASSSSSSDSSSSSAVSYTYKVTNGGAYITGVTGDPSVFYVPSTVEDYGAREEATPGYPVVGIDGNALKNCKNLKELWMPESIEYLDRGIFSGCDSLEEIGFLTPNPTYTIKGNCVIHTADKLIVAAIKTSVIPSDGSATNIAVGAFCGIKGLKSLIIPDCIKYFGDNGTFSNCTDLEYVKVGSGVSWIWDMGTFQGCTSLKTVELSEGTTVIGGYSFADCTSLTSITLPSTVENIYSDAFSNCPNLKDVYYGGYAADRAKIQIDSGNTALTSATWHYGS